jgi:hypothetical protein
MLKVRRQLLRKMLKALFNILLGLLEDPDQFLCVSDQVIAARTLDALDAVLFDKDQHRVRAAFRTSQNVNAGIDDRPSAHPSYDPISEFTQLERL